MSTKIISPIGAEIALPTVAGSASTIGNQRRVRLVNTAGSSHVVTILAADNTVKGSFTLTNHEVAVIHKAHSDKVYADNAAVRAVAIEIRD